MRATKVTARLGSMSTAELATTIVLALDGELVESYWLDARLDGETTITVEADPIEGNDPDAPAQPATKFRIRIERITP